MTLNFPPAFGEGLLDLNAQHLRNNNPINYKILMGYLENKTIKLDPSNKEQIDSAARLHKTLLGYSPVPRMGHLFMTRFYYKKLVEADLIRCILKSCGGKYVGFIAYTQYPYSFMAMGAKKYFFSLSSMLFQSILQKPSRLKVLLKVSKDNNFRQKKHNEEDKIAELLSLGVLKEYLNNIDEATGLRFSHLLFRSMVADLKKDAVKILRIVTRRDNEQALKFYRQYGAQIVDKNYPDQSYLFHLDL